MSCTCGTCRDCRRAQGRKGGLAGAKTKQIRAMQRALETCGGRTASEALAYRLGYTNGYSAGQKTGVALGYRRAWAEALNERRQARAAQTTLEPTR